MSQKNSAPILENKYLNEPSVFQPQNLLREARRQKQISNCNIPAICVLDPDGDLVDYLLEKGKAKKNECWACYHSDLYTFLMGDTEIGIVPCIVGSSYSVLVSEQLFVSGCEFLISITSSGIISEPKNNQKFALITESVRDEGTTYQYLPKEVPAKISESLFQLLNISPLHIIIHSFVFPNRSKNPGGLRGKFSDLRCGNRKQEINSYPAQSQELLGNPYDVGNFGRNGATLLSETPALQRRCTRSIFVQ